MSALQSGHLSPRWCTVSPHDSQKRWCPQGTRAIRGSLRLIRHTLQQSSDALVAGSDVTAASCGSVWSVVCAASSSAPSSSSSEAPRRWSFCSHSTLRCGHTFQLVLLAWGLLHCQLPHCPPLPHRADKSTPALSTPATWCRIVRSCNVHPCHIVLICPLLQSPPLATWSRIVHSCIVHSRKFSIPMWCSCYWYIWK